MKITSIGVGNMGGAVARWLAKGGFDVTVFDLDPEAMQRCADEAGTEQASSLTTALKGADIVLTSLPTTKLVLDTVDQMVVDVASGAIIIDISTIDPDTAIKAQAACDVNGVRFVSCSLGKTPIQAETGEIPLFVGGDKTAIDEAQDVLERMGEKIYRFDDVVGATTFKLVSNLIGMTNVTVLMEGLALARNAGIDDDLFREALEDTGAVSFQSDVRLPWALKGDWSTRFSLDLAAKDVGLALDAASTFNVEAPVAQTALDRLHEASAQGFGREDVVAVARLHNSFEAIDG